MKDKENKCELVYRCKAYQDCKYYRKIGSDEYGCKYGKPDDGMVACINSKARGETFRKEMNK